MNTTGDIIRKSGATFRQIDYWERTGLLIQEDDTRRGTGQPRYFSDAEVKVAQLLVQLSRHGLIGGINRERRKHYNVYLGNLLEHVRLHGLKGKFPFGKDDIVIINLTAIAKQYQDKDNA